MNGLDPGDRSSGRDDADAGDLRQVMAIAIVAGVAFQALVGCLDPPVQGIDVGSQLAKRRLQ